MTEMDANTEAEENVKGGRWSRLKNKLLSSRRGSDDDVTSSQENDLDAFFRAGRPSHESKRPLGPPLDTSQATKWPAISDVMSLRPDEAVDGLPPFRYHKPPRRRGLSVGFLEMRPEIIGEGGDESEEPAIAVARRRKTIARVETLPHRLPPPVPPHSQLPDHYSAVSDERGSQMSQGPRPPPYPTVQAGGRGQHRAPVRSTTLDEQQPRIIHEKQDRKRPSPDGRPQPPYPIDADELTRQSNPANNTVDQVANPSSVPERLRARSDAPMLSISKPDTDMQRPMRQDSWHAMSRMRAEEGRTLSTAGGPSTTLRPGSSGSESSRSSSEANRIPRKRVGSGSESSSRDPSPRFDSRPSTADSLDPAIPQMPQYPPALSSIPMRAAMPIPGGPRLRPRSPRADSPQRPSPKDLSTSPTSRGMSKGSVPPQFERASFQTTSHHEPRPKDQNHLDTLRPPESSTLSDTSSRSPSPGALNTDERAQAYSPSSNSRALPSQAPPKEDKQCIFKCTLDAFGISTPSKGASSNQLILDLPQWRRVQVFKMPEKTAIRDPVQYTDISVLVFDTQCSFTDSVMPLQLFRLDSQRPYALQVLCAPSHMRKLRVRSGHTDAQLAQSLKEASDVIRSQEVVQTWDFADPADMHAFQKAVTGFDVLYDGLTHMLMPSGHPTILGHKHRYKDARVQILSKDKRTCLVAFPADGQALFVELHSRDVYEHAHVKDGQPAVRLIDAQFVFGPESSICEGRSHLPLSMELFANHKGDLTVAFDDEASRAAFTAVLPINASS